MSPLKIAIASLVVGLIGLTASAMPKGERGKSLAEPSYMSLVPLTPGLIQKDLFDNLEGQERTNYRKNAGFLEQYQKGTVYQRRSGEARTKQIISLDKVKSNLLSIERLALTHMQKKAQAHNIPERMLELALLLEANNQEILKVQTEHSYLRLVPLTPGLILEDLFGNLGAPDIRFYRKNAGFLEQHLEGTSDMTRKKEKRTNQIASRNVVESNLLSIERLALTHMQKKAQAHNIPERMLELGVLLEANNQEILKAKAAQQAEEARKAQLSELAHVGLAIEQAEPQLAQEARWAQPTPWAQAALAIAPAEAQAASGSSAKFVLKPLRQDLTLNDVESHLGANELARYRDMLYFLHVSENPGTYPEEEAERCQRRFPNESLVKGTVEGIEERIFNAKQNSETQPPTLPGGGDAN